MNALNNSRVSNALSEDSNMKTCSDERLIVWVVAQVDSASQAFDVLISRYRPWIVQRCRFYLGAEQDAQDVAQQVSLRVFKALGQFSGTSPLKAWLGRITLNCCNSFMRQRGRYVNIEEIELFSEPGQVNDVLTQLEQGQTVGFVLTQLSDSARQILILRFFEDCSLEQIAQCLQVSLSAAKARLYRALAQFKTVYETSFNEKELMPCTI